MNTRKEYELTDLDFERLIDACKPVPLMCLSGGRPMFRSQQENANDAWRQLGKRMGFDYLTVKLVQGRGNDRFFTAIPLSQKEEANGTA